jgi:hypothetical protein
MEGERQILLRDLNILEQMSIELGAYLMSASERWTMGRGDMPRLTIGGVLMRQHRLAVVCGRMQPNEQTRFNIAGNRIDRLQSQHLVRFELRMHQELHSRMGEWIGHLRNWADLGKLTVEGYAKDVDTRVVVTAIVEKLQRPPYRLDPRFPEELSTVDKHLRGCWTDGEFIWSPVWQPAYPRPFTCTRRPAKPERRVFVMSSTPL